mmetsp:Transcript_6459/g.18633  ORF Transcript_6459/g.18633 Transcript_6459/m.18633 type:complete len:299 (-) Transcript_6459:623-1519(-)|eukprot:CAMPEP_0206149542 /NCGR_PEP_ID=MMETSP1473-20131121/37768_1 /ASSEMBLY_ACC=CAM_ASM_001109 /TAXON_ID=1461547 /ORGANISM="Stichococcus sp, Strain RCC1054" /LENGTH=298 /DNA_ID=CAMNT_0053547017 /DNA_START=1820 /DNA_END=2716 /DNA_ORIENTATION=-
MGGILWSDTNKAGTPEHKARGELLAFVHSKFPTIRYKRSRTAKGRDGQPVDLLSVHFQKLCQNARAKLGRKGAGAAPAEASSAPQAEGTTQAALEQDGTTQAALEHEGAAQAALEQEGGRSAASSGGGTADAVSSPAGAQADQREGRVPLEVRVACRCGAVQLRGAWAPTRVYCCHCTQCQSLTGSDYAHLAWFHPGQLKREDSDGAILRWRSGDSTPLWFSCATCHSRTFALRFDPDNPASVLRMVIGVGSVIRGNPRDPNPWAPQEHIFYANRAVNITDGKPKWRRHSGTKRMEES